MLSTDSLRTTKPHPKVYALARDRAEGEPWMVAAHAWDLQGAGRAGMRTAWVSSRDERGARRGTLRRRQSHGHLHASCLIVRKLFPSSRTRENARKLASDAEAQDFVDVARDAESLRQQLLAARNRAKPLQQKLHPANA